MAERETEALELVEPGAESPLDAAVSERDRNTLAMVRKAIAERNVVLAFQPIVQATRTDRAAFYEGLVRILDEKGRVIPARNFIQAVETIELGRIIDCLALEMGLLSLAEDPGLRLAINMSARSIGYPRWRQTLERGFADDPRRRNA